MRGEVCVSAVSGKRIQPVILRESIFCDGIVRHASDGVLKGRKAEKGDADLRLAQICHVRAMLGPPQHVGGDDL